MGGGKSNVQNTHAHGNADTNLLACAHLQAPNKCPWDECEVEVGCRTPCRVEDAVVDGDDGVPAMSFDRRVPCFCCGRALYPGDEGGGKHEQEESNNAKPNGPSDLTSSKS